MKAGVGSLQEIYFSENSIANRPSLGALNHWTVSLSNPGKLEVFEGLKQSADTSVFSFLFHRISPYKEQYAIDSAWRK